MQEETQTELKLTEEQIKILEDMYLEGECPNLKDMVIKVFGDSNLDGKTKEGRLLRKYCKDNNLKFKSNTVVLKGLIELSKQQIRFIENNFRVKTPLEIAREMFSNEELTNLSQEYRTVNAKVTEITDEIKEKNKAAGKDAKKDEFTVINVSYDPEQIVAGEYKPPKTLKQTVDRVNFYLNYGYSEEILKKQQRNELEQLRKYLNVFRFNYQINTYKLQGDRDLFEDAFIRYTHDKPDLTQEDLDQFITLCNQIVRAAEIQRRIEALRSTMANGDLSMRVNEAINVLQNELNACEAIKTRLYNDLTTKRNQRLDEKNDGVEKLNNLVQAWKDEEFRSRTIHLAELEKIKIAEEADKINSMSEIKALLRGATIEELIG